MGKSQEMVVEHSKHQFWEESDVEGPNASREKTPGRQRKRGLPVVDQRVIYHILCRSRQEKGNRVLSDDEIVSTPKGWAKAIDIHEKRRLRQKVSPGTSSIIKGITSRVWVLSGGGLEICRAWKPFQ